MDNGTDDIDPVVLERVRDDLQTLGAGESSAPDVPPALTARILTALRAAPNPGAAPAHALPRPRLRRVQSIGLVVGIGAAVLGAVIGVLMLVHEPAPPPPRTSGPTAEQITVSRPPQPIPLDEAQLAALLTQPPDYGPLTDAQRRASCLTGLGYAATAPVLGARQVDMHGRPAVLLLLPGEHGEDGEAQTVVAKAVAPTCNAASTGLLAETVVADP
ncbi:hypothetical protein [Mycolicibacterium sp. XJ1819]